MSRKAITLTPKQQLKQKADNLKASIDFQKKQSRPTIIRLKVLSPQILTFEFLKKDWKGLDTRQDAERHLIDFKLINSDVFEFLGIEVELTRDPNGACSLQLTTSKYAGCVPILSPATGMPYGELLVEGLYDENLSELISVIKEDIKIEYDERFQINTINTVKPPLYLECQKYIDKYIEAKRYHWRMFKNVERIQPYPTSSTRWDKYAVRDIDPWSTFKYTNKSNILSCDHEEWRALTYILDISIHEIMKPSTPLRSKAPYLTKISVLRKQYDPNSLKTVSKISIRVSDPYVIKETKEIGLRILRNNVNSRRAWRIDYAEFFERYVQYLLKQVSHKKNAKLDSNKKYPIRGEKTAWTLSYLEPDAVMYRNDTQYIIDAKYKSHMYNVNNTSDELRDSFRKDLHQVLAYSSFSNTQEKNVILMYPSDFFIKKKINIRSRINNLDANVHLIGIPLSIKFLPDVVENMCKVIQL